MANRSPESSNPDWVSERFYTLEKRLFGNGQPGCIQEMERRLDDKIDENEAAMNERLETVEKQVNDVIKRQEKWYYIAIGIATAVTWMSGTGTFSLAKLIELFKH